MRIDAHLDTLSDKLCQVNTYVDHIAQQQAAMGDFTVTSPSPLTSEDESDDGSSSDDVEDDGASSPNDDEMST